MQKTINKLIELKHSINSTLFYLYDRNLNDPHIQKSIKHVNNARLEIEKALNKIDSFNDFYL